MPRVVSITEVRKGEQRAIAFTIEVDVVDAPFFIEGMDTTPLDPAQVQRLFTAAEAVARARQAELEAQAAAAKAKLAQEAAAAEATAAEEARIAAERAKAEADAQPADATGEPPASRM